MHGMNFKRFQENVGKAVIDEDNFIVDSALKDVGIQVFPPDLSVINLYTIRDEGRICVAEMTFEEEAIVIYPSSGGEEFDHSSGQRFSYEDDLSAADEVIQIGLNNNGLRD